MYSNVFDKIKKKRVVCSSTYIIFDWISTVDTFLFFSISFYATGVPWVTLSLGDLAVKF